MAEDLLSTDAEDWALVVRLLPPDWARKAHELGAVRRLREFRDVETLLRVLMIHLCSGHSLRQTVVLAAEGGLVKISDVALLKRLRNCGDWFQWLCAKLMEHWSMPPAARPLLASGRRLRLVDGTTVSEPGAVGANWRLHYSVSLPSLACDELHLTDSKVGETLRRFRVQPGDVLIGDRLYANRAGVRHVCEQYGDVILRLTLGNMPLEDSRERPFDILRHLRRLTIGTIGEWPVRLGGEPDLPSVEGRVCAIKKSRQAARISREKVQREARADGRQIRPETIEAAGYIFVFTTLGSGFPAPVVLETYRGRWQVELAFKRLKSLLEIGHLKKYDPVGAKAWLQGKLLVSIILETLLGMTERFSPWGYPIRPLSADTLPVA